MSNGGRTIRLLAAIGIGITAALTTQSISFAQQPATAEQPLKPEKNPPGDIPDSQVFVRYSSPLGFNFKVPEGWARKDLSDGAAFVDKYGVITVTESDAGSAPDAAAAKQTLVPAIEKNARAVTVKKIRAVKLPAGAAVLISYDSNSDANAVTNKAIRLENDRYYLWKDGKLVSLNFSAPAGADNADQWDMMAKSFRWR
jgi:hypothetical protein